MPFLDSTPSPSAQAWTDVRVIALHAHEAGTAMVMPHVCISLVVFTSLWNRSWLLRRALELSMHSIPTELADSHVATNFHMPHLQISNRLAPVIMPKVYGTLVSIVQKRNERKLPYSRLAAWRSSTRHYPTYLTLPALPYLKTMNTSPYLYPSQ